MHTKNLAHPPRVITRRSAVIPIRWLHFLQMLAQAVPRRRARILGFGLAATIALGAGVGMTGRWGHTGLATTPDDGMSLALIGEADEDFPPMFTPTEYARFREFQGHFRRTAAFFERAGRLNIDGATHGVFVTEVLDDFFGTVDCQPALGRCIKGVETGLEGSDIVVLSHDLWQRAFHSDPDIVGKQIELDHVRKTVIGVMPVGFQFPDLTDVWLPFAIMPEMRYDWTSLYLRLAVRTQPGSTLMEAEAQTREIVQILDASSRNRSERRAVTMEAIR